MTRGIQLINNKFYHVDIGNITFNYFKFLRTSEPIVEISYNNINKYQPISKGFEIKNINNNIVMKKNNANKNYSGNNTIHNSYFKENNRNISYNKERKSPSNRNLNNNYNNNIINNEEQCNYQNSTNNSNLNKNIQNNYSNYPNSTYEIISNNNNNNNKNNNYYNNINNNINNNYNNNINNNINNNMIHNNNNGNLIKMEQSNKKNSLKTSNITNYTIPQHIKKKIYYWLIDLGIIKEKKIKIEDLPIICINGVLFCDLINRCEGKNEIIKGIIRKTKTKSDIQVNINKVLDYLRSIERFSSRHLWNNSEIARGDKKVIWELLEDICNYYSKNFSKNKVINRSRSSLQNRLNSFDKFTPKNLNTKSNIDTLNLSGTPVSNSKLNLDFNVSNISYATSPNNLITNNNNSNNNINSKNNNNISSYNSKSQNNNLKNNNNIQKKKNMSYNKNDILNVSNYTNSNNFNHMNDKDEEMFNLNLNKPIYRQKKNLTSNNSFKLINNIKNNNNSIKRNKSESKYKNLNNRINTTLLSNKDVINTTMNQSSLSYKNNNSINSCFLLFEKSTAKRMRSEIGRINKYSDLMKNNNNVHQDNKNNLLLNLIV